MRARDIITKQLVILAGYEPSNEDTIASWHLFERDTDAIIAALRAAGYELVPTTPTPEMVRAAIESQATDDEGTFPPLLDLIDFSGENKTRTVIRAALTAAILAASSPRPPIGENK